MISPILAVLLLATRALAHMQLADPLPIRSSLDSTVPNDSKDYSYTAPLVSNGLPYPCKGYLDSDASLMKSKKTWAAGSTQTYTATGTAIHGGGSCQVSLSYDMGKTWNVIQSTIGGCMMESTSESFTIPQAAPSGEAVFSWTWFNNLGNREMYQNCAIVTVTNGGSGLNSRDHPAPFVANAGSVNSCSTVGSRDVVFPDPGAAVTYAGGFRGTVPQAGLNVVGTGCTHPGGADGAGTRAGNGSEATVPDTKELLASASSTSTQQSTATTSPASTAASPTAPAPSTTPSAVRVCRRRTGNTKRTLVPAAEIRSHRERRSHRGRHASWAQRRMDPESRSQSGRVAALPASRPVYAGKA